MHTAPDDTIGTYSGQTRDDSGSLIVGRNDYTDHGPASSAFWAPRMFITARQTCSVMSA